ncbi:MAG: hypothetical protein JSV88_13905 [Candidatus Aminicenantes bacterium]|nr:MAG: hypothetical protein JSV88_13905 [Candidatus Aminicenantes bacterium]
MQKNIVGLLFGYLNFVNHGGAARISPGTPAVGPKMRPTAAEGERDLCRNPYLKRRWCKFDEKGGE